MIKEQEDFYSFKDALKLTERNFSEWKNKIYFFVVQIPFNRWINLNSIYKEPGSKRDWFIRVIKHFASRGFCCFDLVVEEQENGEFRFMKINKILFF